MAHHLSVFIDDGGQITTIGSQETLGGNDARAMFSCALFSSGVIFIVGLPYAKES
jgi:hypothetical protein